MMNRWKRRDKRAQAGHEPVTMPEAATSGRPETTGLSGKTTGGHRDPVFTPPSQPESTAHWHHDSQKPDSAALRMLAIIRRKGLGLFEQ